jgi:Polysaccharide lyase
MRGPRQLLLAAGLSVALVAGCGTQAEPDRAPADGQSGVLFTTDYDQARAVQDVWAHVQEPSVDGEPQSDRITIAPSPTSEDRVLRVELRPGDVQESGGYEANRAEVYDRHASPGSSTPPEEWPDPVGSVRWYDFTVHLPTDFATADDDKWLDLTQWKGYRGGSPPLALEVKRNQLRLGGTEGSDSLGRVDKGEWTRLTFGIRWSPDDDGWVEVWRDGELVVERTAGPTMDVVDDEPDPVYLKQGIYRTKDWDVTHVVYFGPLTIATTRDDAMGDQG